MAKRRWQNLRGGRIRAIIGPDFDKEGLIIPNTRSAKRQLRKALRRRRENDLRKSAIRYWHREIRKLVAAGQVQEAQKLFPNFQKAVDKAASRRAIHPNRAARLKARLSRRLQIT